MMDRKTGKKEQKLHVLQREGGKVYNTGIYVRLSVDGGSGHNESVESQIEIARAYMNRQPDMILTGCYIDVGKTGTDFDRAGFKRLMEDVRHQAVNCIIVKDFSRFGRDYIETGNYIQKIFPFLEIRFIAVTDGYDSLLAPDDGIGVSLKNLVNEMYARDIALKVKSSNRARWEEGNYTGGTAPYGYCVQRTKEGRRLFREEEPGKIVKEIYQLYDSGKNVKEISELLYRRGVHRPADYYKYGHTFRGDSEKLIEWSRETIRRILLNPVYLGCQVRDGNGGKESGPYSRKDMASGSLLVKDNTHEPLVRKEQFFRVAERFQRHTDSGGRDKIAGKAMQEADIFEELLYCGECGGKMCRVGHADKCPAGNSPKRYGYFCRKSTRIDGLRCERKYITEKKLVLLVKQALKREFYLCGVEPESMTALNRRLAESEKKKWEGCRDKILKAIEEGRRKAGEKYLSYRKKETDREGFLVWKKENENKLKILRERLEETENRLAEADSLQAFHNNKIRELIQSGSDFQPDGEIIHSLFQRINIYPDRRVEFILRFACGIGRAVERKEGPDE